MSDAARVDDIDPIRDFKVYLAKFGEMAGRALGDADSDIHRMTRWLEGEGLNYWTSTIRKRQEILAKAEEAFRFKRLYKDASGSTPSAVEEQKAVKIAKDRLQSAQDKLANVKKWTKELQKQSTLYRGGVSRFSNDVSAVVPAMVSHLAALLEHLDKYMGIEAELSTESQAAISGAGAAREPAGASMARSAEELEKKGIDPAELRASVPSMQAIMAAKPAESEPLQLACGKATSEHIHHLAKVGVGDAPGKDERIVISPGIYRAEQVYLVRLDTAGIQWYFGAINALDSGVYETIRTGDFMAGRPDLAELLRLPVGCIGVVGLNGLEAIFDAENKSILQPG